MIYLDHAATTFPKPPGVSIAILRALEECTSLGRSGHQTAVAASEVAFACRSAAGKLFDAPPEQVVFTMNTTHGLNMAIRSLIAPGDSVVISGFEHNAVVRPLHALGARYQVAGRNVFDPEDTLRAFSQAITSRTKVVICTHVSNVFGYILPLEEIADLCTSRGVPLIVDAAQSAGVLPISMKRLHAAFLAMPGHKGLFGPQGTGLLICGNNQLKPLLYGGTGSLSRSREMPAYLPDRGEAGTQNIHGIAGLLAGMEFVRQCSVAEIMQHEKTLLKHLVERLSFLEEDEVFFGDENTQSGVLSLNIQSMDCEMLAGKLAEEGIAVRAGLHCAPLAHESVGTLESGTVRISLSALSTMAHVDQFADCLQRLVKR